VSIFDRFFPGKAARFEVPLGPVAAAMARAATLYETRDADAALVRARLADACRDASVDPMAPTRFDASARDLDAEAWRRLAALTVTLDAAELRAGVLGALQLSGADAVIASFVETAKHKPRLEMGVLCKSSLRVEELTRALLARIDVPVAGETREQSRVALERLDYERVLTLAEQAREAARARMENLKKAQEEDDKARGPRRGKW